MSESHDELRLQACRRAARELIEHGQVHHTERLRAIALLEALIDVIEEEREVRAAAMRPALLAKWSTALGRELPSDFYPSEAEWLAIDLYAMREHAAEYRVDPTHSGPEEREALARKLLDSGAIREELERWLREARDSEGRCGGDRP